MSLWNDFGFEDEIYRVRPLFGDEDGSNLLVGRDNEVKILQERWESSSTPVTIEGDNGVGKTSLVAVAAYRALQKFRSKNHGTLVLPVSEIFQLKKTGNDELAENFYSAVVSTLVEYADELKNHGVNLAEVARAREEIENPFSDANFEKIAKTWLKTIDKSSLDCCLVSILDNLEILETSENARVVIGEMRDGLFSLPAVKWVLCGANGIVRSAVSSSRLAGWIATPLELPALGEEEIPLVIERRVERYRLEEGAVPPVDSTGFQFIYQNSGKNLRNSFKHAEDFSMSIEDRAPFRDKTPEERFENLASWLATEADLYLRSANNVGNRAWEVFDDLVLHGGTCSPGDFEDFGFNSQQAMRPSIKKLEDAQLVHSAVDDQDQRRKSIVLTSNGWLVNFRRQQIKGLR